MANNPNPFFTSDSDQVADELKAKAALINGQTEAMAQPPAAAPVPELPSEPVQQAPAAQPPSKRKASAGDVMPPAELRPVFEASAQHFGVPLNVLMAIGHQESRYNASAVGQPTKYGTAKGMMQNLDSTAKGLGINAMDPNEAIPAAAKQIRERLDKGYSMEDAVKEHFAGPDRKLWGAKTDQYGVEVMDTAGKIGSAILGEKPAAAPQDPAANAMGVQQSPADYERTFRANNPTASPAAVKMAMDQYAVQKAAAGQKKVDAVGQRFDTLASPEATFDAKLNQKLAGRAAGVVPALPGKLQPAAPPPAFDADRAANESQFSAAASYLGKSFQSGVYDLMGAGAKVLDEVNPFTITPQQAATLFKDDPKELRRMQDESVVMVLSRFAKAMSKNSEESIGEISDRAKRDYGDLEYATTDTDKAAYLSPVKVIGDAVRSLPTSAAMAVSVYLTRGAAATAERNALAAGMGAEAAKQAGIAAGARTMATAGAASEGTVGYAQQALSSASDAAKVSQADLEKSPKYQQLLKDGYTPQTAREQIIADTGEQAGKIAGIVDAAVNQVGGQFLGKIISEGGKLIPRIMKGAANESITEFAQSAGEQAGQNQAVRDNINPNQSLTEGVGEAAVAGAAVGGLMGGVMSGAGGRAQEAAPAPRAPVSPLAPTQAAPVPAAAVPAAPVSDTPLTSAVADSATPAARVVVTNQAGNSAVGTMAQYQEDDAGGFTARIVGDDGQVYTITDQDGVQLAPVEQEAGPLSSAVDTVAEDHAIAPAAPPASALAEVAAVKAAEQPESKRESAQPAEVQNVASPRDGNGDVGGRSDRPAARDGTDLDGRSGADGPLSGNGRADAAVDGEPVATDLPATSAAADSKPALKEWERNPYHAYQASSAERAQAYMEKKGADPAKFEVRQTGSVRWQVMPKEAPAASVEATASAEKVPEVAPKKEPIVMDEEAYLATNGASKQGFGDAALHRSSSNVSESSRKASIDRQAKLDSQLSARREELRAEYAAKVAAGEMRAPTLQEEAQRIALGDPDSESAQAAKRIMEKHAKRKAAKLEAAVKAPPVAPDTPGFQRFIKDSKVVDEAGKPLAMYHGTSNAGFESFDTYASNYGLMGMGGYFTADPEVASSYTTKGKGKAPGVYKTYLAIKNPIDMDAKTDGEAWRAQFEGIEAYHEGGATNESWYRAAEDLMADERIPAYEGAEAMQEGLRAMGHDGITHIGGGRVAKDGVKHRVYVAFDPEQIKSATGNNGDFDPSNADIRYSIKDGAPQAEFGPVHTEYRDDAAGAVKRLMADKTGEAIVHRDDIGDISLVYGDGKMGLSHVAGRRGAEFMARLPGLLQDGKLYTKPGQADRVFIGTDRDEAVIRFEWDGKAKTWLLSAYEKYPDLKAGGAVQESRRSETVAERSAPAPSIEELRKSITGGVLGKVIDSMIDAGMVVLHTGPKPLPKGVGTNIKGVQAATTPDGKIHLVASNLTAANARAVMLHEAFHEGAEKLLGTEQWAALMGRMGSLYRQGEQSSGKAKEFFDKARKRVAAAKAKGGVSTKMEVEEFAAYAIEEYESAPATVRKWVDDLIAMVKVWMVKRFGKQIGQVTPAQLSAMARWALMDHAVTRGHEFAGGMGPAFSTTEADTRYSVAGGPTGNELTPAEQGRARKFQELVQDNINRVRQVQKRIEEVAGVPLSERNDYVGAEINRPGRIAARLEDAESHLTGPLMERLAKSGFTQSQLSELLHAMHAKERNEAVAKINPDFQDGGSGMTNDEAEAILTLRAGDTELHAIADQARNIAKATLDLKLAYGLITAEQHEMLANSYENYVPLKGDGEYGPKVKRAMGHDEREEYIVENIARDYQQAVVVGEKNLARQSLLRMVLQNPDPELWTVGAPPKGRFVAGKVYAIMDGNTKVATFTARSQVDAFLEGKGPAASNYTVVDSNGEQVKEFAKPLQDNEVMVYVKGDPVRIQIFDKQLANQIRPLNQGQMGQIMEFMRGANRYLSKIYTGYNPAFILRNVARDSMTGTINMLGNNGVVVAAKAWSQYPLAVKALGQYAATGKAPAGRIGDLMTEYRMNGGKTGASWMSDFEQQGKTLERLFDDSYGAVQYAKDGKPTKAAKIAGRKFVGGMAHIVEIANQATENALRLSLYIAMRDKGATPGKAAQAAKSVTVDFDRKGTATGALGAIYLFFNPAVQGTANAIKALSIGKHRGQAWAALGGLAALGAYAASAGIDDDKDRWLGEGWDIRTKNLILNIGDKQLRIPLSQEYAPAYALGVALAEARSGESKMRSAARLVSSFIDAYFPFQGAIHDQSDHPAQDFALAMTPTIIKPAVTSAFNRNSFGSQIVPETETTKDRPDNLKMSRGTKNTVYDKAAQGVASLGEMMGAGKYENDITKVSPETLKMLWRTYTGGLGQFVTDTASLAYMGATDRKQLETGDYPFLKDFVKTPDVKPIQGRYYDLSGEARAAITEFAMAKKLGDGDAQDKFMEDETKVKALGLTKMITKTNKAVGELKDEAVEVAADTKMSPTEKRARLKELEREQESLYREAIEVFKQP